MFSTEAVALHLHVPPISKATAASFFTSLECFEHIDCPSQEDVRPILFAAVGNRVQEIDTCAPGGGEVVRSIPDNPLQDGGHTLQVTCCTTFPPKHGRCCEALITASMDKVGAMCLHF